MPCPFFNSHVLRAGKRNIPVKKQTSLTPTPGDTLTKGTTSTKTFEVEQLYNCCTRSKIKENKPFCNGWETETVWTIILSLQGPDGIRDHRTRRPEHTHYIGATSPAIEGSSDAGYLWRPASCFSSPLLRRCQYAREIGWGVRELSYFTWRNLQSGAQIKVRKTS